MPEPVPLPTRPTFKNLTGQRFGNLEVLYYIGKKYKSSSLWYCKCDCGNFTEVVSNSLLKGDTKTCNLCSKTRLKDIEGKRLYKKPENIECSNCKNLLPFNEEYFHKSNSRAFKLSYKCKLCINIESTQYRSKIKEEVLNYYGNGNIECKLCHIKDIDCLTLDHINGSGKEDREEKVGPHFYETLKKLGYPEGLRVLCIGCNASISRYGYSPYEHPELAIDVEELIRKYV